MPWKMFYHFFILLFPIIYQQGNAEWLDLGTEFGDLPADGSYFLLKRYLGALAKNKALPVGTGYPVPKRSVPPMITVYGKPGTSKRYLGALARNGDLNNSKPQQKKTVDDRMYDELFGFDNNPNGNYFQTTKKNGEVEIPIPLIMKEEFMKSVEPIVLEMLHKDFKHYDPKKVDMFLINLANAVFDRNEPFNVDHIRSLVSSGYFDPEVVEDPEVIGNLDSDLLDIQQKRNIQSLVREHNVSFSGVNQPQASSESIQDPIPISIKYETDSTNDDDLKKNLQVVLNKRYLGAMAKNRGFPKHESEDAHQSGEFQLINKDDIAHAPHFLHPIFHETNFDFEENVFKDPQSKRHTMYDINEPIASALPYVATPTNEQTDYNDYTADQMNQDTPVIGKRYLGALARSGSLPRGFVLRYNRAPEVGTEKRHIGAMARLGMLTRSKPAKGYSVRADERFGVGGPPMVAARRNAAFRNPLASMPRALLLKAPQDFQHCSCKRSPLVRWPTSFWRKNFVGSHTTTSKPFTWEFHRKTSSRSPAAVIHHPFGSIVHRPPSFFRRPRPPSGSVHRFPSSMIHGLPRTPMFYPPLVSSRRPYNMNRPYPVRKQPLKFSKAFIRRFGALLQKHKQYT